MQAFRITSIQPGQTSTANSRIAGTDTLDRKVSHDLTPEQFEKFQSAQHKVGDWVTHNRDTGEFEKAKAE